MSGNPPVSNSQLEPQIAVPLALSAHTQAERFRRHQPNPQKAKQIYLNTLAVYAVNFYLQCRGFETELEQSASWDPAMQMLMDVADLVVKDRGQLECRPVLPNASVVHVPVEVWADRLGYVAVQLDESLRSATLLGFVDKVTKSELPLSQLQSLAELPRHLNQTRFPLVNLSQWLQGIVEAGWQVVEDFTSPAPAELAFGFRGTPNVSARQYKLIELAALGQSVVMIVTVQAAEQEIDICVEVQPPKGQTYLPDNVQLMVLDEEGEVVVDAHARRDNQQMQLELSGEPGDRFSVKVTLGDVSVTEDFVI